MSSVQLTPSVVPLPLPWRDPHTVSKSDLRACIEHFEQACAAEPHSPDLRTCLGIAHAMNLDVYASMSSLEKARELDPSHFWAQQKFAELLYRLRALPRAEEETVRALNLATTPIEAAIARTQLSDIRRRIREGTQKPAWTKPLWGPALILVGLFVVLSWLAVRI